MRRIGTNFKLIWPCKRTCRFSSSVLIKPFVDTTPYTDVDHVFNTCPALGGDGNTELTEDGIVEVLRSASDDQQDKLASALTALVERKRVTHKVGVSALQAVYRAARRGYRSPVLLRAALFLGQEMVLNGVAKVDEVPLSRLVRVLGAFGLAAEAGDVLRVVIRCNMWPTVFLLNDVMKACRDAGDIPRLIAVFGCAGELGIPLHEASRRILAFSLTTAAFATGNYFLARLLPSLRAATPAGAKIPGASLLPLLSRKRLQYLPARYNNSFHAENTEIADAAAASEAWRLCILLLVHEGPGCSHHPESALCIYDLALRTLIRHCLRDTDGAMFEQLWAADVNLARLHVAAPKSVVLSARKAGQIESLGISMLSIRETGPRDSEAKTLSPPNPSLEESGGRSDSGDSLKTSSYTDTIFADGSAIQLVNARAIAMIDAISDELAAAQRARLRDGDSRAALCDRARVILATMQALAVPPAPKTLARYFAVLLGAGLPHLLRPAMSDLQGIGASAVAAKHLAEVVDSYCVENHASNVLWILPDLTRRLGIVILPSTLRRLLVAARTQWLSQQPPQCPSCAHDREASAAPAQSSMLRRERPVSTQRLNKGWYVNSPLPVVQCRASCHPPSPGVGACALFPSQQLSILEAAGILADVPEDILVGLAAAAARCGGTYW